MDDEAKAGTRPFRVELERSDPDGPNDRLARSRGLTELSGAGWGASGATRRAASNSPNLGRVAGVHVNAATVAFGDADEAKLARFTGAEKGRFGRPCRFTSEGNACYWIRDSRPRTLAYGLTGSPVDQLARIAEKCEERNRPPEKAMVYDRMLTNVMPYRLTADGASSARLCCWSLRPSNWPTPSGVPTGVAVFAEEVSIRRSAGQGDNIVRWSEFDRGGRSAATEAPDLLVDGARAFFRGLR